MTLGSFGGHRRAGSAGCRSGVARGWAKALGRRSFGNPSDHGSVGRGLPPLARFWWWGARMGSDWRRLANRTSHRNGSLEGPSSRSNPHVREWHTRQRPNPCAFVVVAGVFAPPTYRSAKGGVDDAREVLSGDILSIGRRGRFGRLRACSRQASRRRASDASWPWRFMFSTAGCVRGRRRFCAHGANAPRLGGCRRMRG